MYLNVQDAFRGVESVLIPHRLKRQTMSELLFHMNQQHENSNTQIISSSSCPSSPTSPTADATTASISLPPFPVSPYVPVSVFVYRRISQRILNSIRSFLSRGRQKSYLIFRKQVTMREIRQRTRSRYLIHHHDPDTGTDLSVSYGPGSEIAISGAGADASGTGFPSLPAHILFEYLPYPEAIAPMESAFHSRVPLRPAKLMRLKMLRNSLLAASNKALVVQEMISKIEAMLVCKSVYHERSAGCLKCGGVIRQHQLLVNAVNRANGRMVLVAYEFELQVTLS
jgi:hypothetical protein